jgi:hypothetical protein
MWHHCASGPRLATDLRYCMALPSNSGHRTDSGCCHNITRNPNILSLNTTLFYKENQLPTWVNDGSRQRVVRTKF